MNNHFYIEVNCQQRNFEGERISGDVFLSKRIPEENRVIAILSDGMGHGVKANILATLTATLAMNFTKEHKDTNVIAETVMKALPECSNRKMSYSTFTIVDIAFDGSTQIIEYGNPQSIIVRESKIFEPEWQCVILHGLNAGKDIRTCRFTSQKEDRIVFYSDGIVQSGTGTTKYPEGWGMENTSAFVQKIVSNNKSISGQQLATKMVNMAFQNDGFSCKDDISCAVIYFREPRKLLLCSGPPVEPAHDAAMAGKVKGFDGKKIISGATTSNIIASQLGINIAESKDFEDPTLPPASFMEGIDLVSEGILTLSKVDELLKKYPGMGKRGRGPADQIVKLLLESDEIHLLIGMRINQAHHVPGLPLELEVRPTVARRILRTLEDKYLKEVHLTYM